MNLTRSLPRYRQAVLVIEPLNRTDEQTSKLPSQAIGLVKNTVELCGIALGMQTRSLSRPRAVIHSKSALDEQGFDIRDRTVIYLNRMESVVSIKSRI